MRRRLPFLVIVLLLVALGLLLYVGAVELPIEVAKTTHVFFNYGEAAVWGIAGTCVFWRSRKQHSAARILGTVAAMAFLAFGVSDLIETRTGAWYDPWWLFVWKAICVLILLSAFASMFVTPDAAQPHERWTTKAWRRLSNPGLERTWPLAGGRRRE